MTFDEWLNSCEFPGETSPVEMFRECWEAAQREDRNRCAKIAESVGIYGHTVSQAKAKAIAEAIWEASSKRAI